MSKIGAAFARCREEGRAAFIPYLTAGDPDLRRGEELLHALVRGGADLIELGVPFSDPIADGPVNQRAATRALEAGTTLSGILRMVARTRADLGVPVVLFTYFNPIHARGVTRFAEQAASSGVDGVLCVDLPPEEGEQHLAPMLRERDVDLIYLLSPTSGKRRARRIGEHSSGFVYYVSRTGVTGARERLPRYLLQQAKRLRRKLELPLAVGFGISTSEQVGQVAAAADGVVVGSALVEQVERHGADLDLPTRIEEAVRELRAGIG